MRWTRHAACIEEKRNMYKMYVKSLKERPFTRPRHRWEDKDWEGSCSTHVIQEQMSLIILALMWFQVTVLLCSKKWDLQSHCYTVETLAHQWCATMGSISDISGPTAAKHADTHRHGQAQEMFFTHPGE
jgi:hypothetical protein